VSWTILQSLGEWSTHYVIMLGMFITIHCQRYACNIPENGPISVNGCIKKSVPTHLCLFRMASCTYLFPPLFLRTGNEYISEMLHILTVTHLEIKAKHDDNTIIFLRGSSGVEKRTCSYVSLQQCRVVSLCADWLKNLLPLSEIFYCLHFLLFSHL
jgi:hypothetical protein